MFMENVDDIFSEEFSFSYPLFNVRQVHEYLRNIYPIVKPNSSKKFKVIDYNKLILFNKDYSSIKLEENRQVVFEHNEINPETLAIFIYSKESLIDDWDDWDDYEIYNYDEDEENYRI